MVEGAVLMQWWFCNGGFDAMVEGAVLMLGVAGPFMVEARPNIRGRMDKVKVNLLLTICWL